MPSTAAMPSLTVPEFELTRARALAAKGQDAAAQGAYLALLGRDPTHLQCLTELAKLAFATGFRSAARTAYEQAVRFHPSEPMAHVNLANVLKISDEPARAKWHYMAALTLDARFAQAHQGLALILADEGDHAGAARHRDQGFAGENAIVRRPFRGAGEAPRVLLIVSARGGNIPTDGWLDDRHYDITAVYAEYFDPARDLPPHDLVFNAIGDADLSREALRHAVEICARTSKPVLNRPEHVAPTGRATTAVRLGHIAHARVPKTRLMPTGAIRKLDNMSFPVLVRRPGYHTGQHFERADSRIGLIATLDVFEAAGADELLLIDYLDARGSDGMARKYRVMFIDGVLYPLHLAISGDWKVHYFTSAMADDADFRAEEQRFLRDPTEVIGASGMAALTEIATTLGLDYAGIDFGLDADGRILVFEVNATMVLIPPGDDPRWDYRRPAIGAAFAAVKAMLGRRLAGD